MSAKFIPLLIPFFLAACSGTPPSAPPASAAQINVKSMSLAAQRFDQFCIVSINGPRDGVDLANAFYNAQAFPDLGGLKLSAGGSSEDIGVQFDTRRNGCRLTSSQGKSPNGDAELKALATAFAARNGGTIEGGGAFVYTVKTPSATAAFQYADTKDGLYFQVEY